MAKQNKNKKNNNGYFVRNVQQNGEHFLTRKTAYDIQRDSKFIFRDLAYADPAKDIPNISKYFVNLTFVTNLKESAYQEYFTTNAAAIGLQNYIMLAERGIVYDTGDNRLSEQLVLFKNKATAYATIVSTLNNIISLFSFIGDDEQLRQHIEVQLTTLAMQIAKYKRIL